MEKWRKLCSLTKEEIISLQEKKLRHFLANYIYPFSPHYRNLFKKHRIKPKHIKKISDLKIIPFTTKEDFTSSDESYLDFILTPTEESIREYLPKISLFKLFFLKLFLGKKCLLSRLKKEFKPVFLTATTGTTTRSVSFLYTLYDIRNLYICGKRLMDVFSLTDETKAVNIFPYAPHLAFWQTVFASLSAGNFTLSTGGGKVMGSEGNIAIIKKVKPQTLVGEPNYLYHILKIAAERDEDFSFLHTLILGASRLPPGFKNKLKEVLSCVGARPRNILGTYGFTEAKYAWGECPSHLEGSSGYHLYPDKEIFEVIDPQTGEVLPEEEDGELVYTSLDARGSCVLRYRTGDIVKGGITYKKCPYCGRTVPRINSDICRQHNIKTLKLSKVKGTLVNLNNIASILEEESLIDEWQIEIGKRDNDPYELDKLTIYVSCKLQGDSRQEELKENITRKINITSEITPDEIIFLSHQEMVKKVKLEVANKAIRIVDLREK